MVLGNVYDLGHAAGESLHGLLVQSGGCGWWLGRPQVWSLVRYARSAPVRYRDWWVRLYSEEPIHVVIETALIAFIVYMLAAGRWSGKADWRQHGRRGSSSGGNERLSEEEKEELIAEWRDRLRSPLVPPRRSHDTVAAGIVVAQLKGSTMTLKLRGQERTALNFATHDFLGMSCPDAPADPLKEASKQALNTYGCGSCGPRGFYGTIDAHLDLESAISRFTHTDGAIMYSDGASAASSTVAAFAKRGDLLVVDDGIYEALGTGVKLSRANVKYFKHNDIDDLRRVLENVQATDASLKRKSADQRRFIVVEGLYKNHGTICKLDQIIPLKERFCYRLILDESFSFGVLGATGRGALEHHHLSYMRDAEIIIISLENALASIGGVSVGNEEVVDHQRLSGAGYCFSASAPPFVASAAMASLNRLQSEPQVLFTLRANIAYFHQQVKVLMKGMVPEKVVVTSDPFSPIVFFHLVVNYDHILTREEQTNLLDRIANACLEDGGILIISTGTHVLHYIQNVPAPALRVTISAAQSKSDLDLAVTTLDRAMKKIMA